MSVQLNHTIVWCRDKQRSATFLTEILGRPMPTRFGPFLVVEVDNGASLDFHETDGEIAPQHYAFLIGEDDFDEIFGVYFEDPDGHLLEFITRPYGSGG
jgi:catechol 2,3-dioxygenase-like lactoylglutathione lyase family enzyme